MDGIINGNTIDLILFLLKMAVPYHPILWGDKGQPAIGSLVPCISSTEVTRYTDY